MYVDFNLKIMSVIESLWITSDLFCFAFMEVSVTFVIRPGGTLWIISADSLYDVRNVYVPLQHQMCVAN